MFFIVLAAWVVGIIVSFINGNRKLPFIILLLGGGVLATVFSGHGGWFGVAALAILSAIIWIANKIDMT
jgi:hypothetical protein